MEFCVRYWRGLLSKLKVFNVVTGVSKYFGPDREKYPGYGGLISALIPCRRD